MKFSWQLTNSFLHIHNKYFLQILEQLTLSGIETEEIEDIVYDKILNLSITTNRKEIKSTFSLAREISIITKRKLYVKPIKFNTNKKIIKFNYEQIKYRRTHIIKKNIHTKTPIWITKELKIHNTYCENSLNNIQEYIKIKWGKTFEIINFNRANEVIFNNNHKKHNLSIKQFINNKIKIKNNEKIQIIIFDINYKFIKYPYYNHDISEFYENYYTESINIIKEVERCTIGKYYEQYEEIINNDKKILLNKSTINNWLGSTKEKKKKFLQTKEINNILYEIKFFTQYIKNKKAFIVKIPQYRKDDINNNIDIIEEIGKRYGFNKFYNKYTYKKINGRKSEKLKKINQIRNTLRKLGFNEVINCSIVNNTLKSKNSIKLYNPINEEQTYLRNNITYNLIENYIHHIKYSNDNLLIFEIGNTFNKHSETNVYNEEKSIGGLIYAPDYHRINWKNKSNSINLFHIKGLLEVFFEQIESNFNFSKIEIQEIKKSLQPIVNNNKTIGLYNKNNNKMIGVVSQISNQLSQLRNNKNNKVYIFELKLNELINSINCKQHIDYNTKSYSKYPSITRDISIKVSENKHIKEIKQTITSVSQELIESIKIFNEYSKIDIKTNQTKKFIGIRITYRSMNRTLNIKDIQTIDQHLIKIINNT